MGGQPGQPPNPGNRPAGAHQPCCRAHQPADDVAPLVPADGPVLQGGELDAEIDRLAAAFPEPGRSPESPAVAEERARQYERVGRALQNGVYGGRTPQAAGLTTDPDATWADIAADPEAWLAETRRLPGCAIRRSGRTGHRGAACPEPATRRTWHPRG